MAEKKFDYSWLNCPRRPKVMEAKEMVVPSPTLPNQSATIAELVDRFRTGIPMNERPMVYGSQLGDEKEIFPAFVRDLTEIDEARKQTELAKTRLNEEITASKKSKKQAEIDSIKNSAVEEYKKSLIVNEN